MKNLLLLSAIALLVSVNAEELVIGDFETGNSIIKFWTSKDERWGACGAVHEIVPMNATRGNSALKVVFNGNKEKKVWPYFDYTFLPGKRDLSKWRFLKFNVFNPTNHSIQLRGRFTALNSNAAEVLLWPVFSAKPGMNSFVLELKKENGNDPKAFPWKNVKTLNFYLDAPKENATLFIDNIRFDDGREVAVLTKVLDVKAVAVRFSTPPAIDGVLNDACWKNAVKTSAFKLNNNGSTPVNSSVAMIGFDDTNLYIAVVCSEPETGKIKKKCGLCEPPVCNDDSIEIFLATGQRPGEYFQFIANTGKGHYDGAVIDGVFVPKRDPEWCHVVSIGKKEWFFEAAIPFSDLRFHPNSPFDWHINIARNAKASHSELSALAPTSASLHAPHKFAKLDGMTPELGKYRLRVASFTPGKAIPGDNTAVLELEGFDGNKTKNCVFVMNLTDSTGKTKESKTSFSVKPGVNQYRFPYRIALPGNFHVRGKITGEDGETLALAPSCQVVSADVVELAFAKPHYKDAIFATQNLKTAECVVTLNASDSARKGGMVEFSLSENGKTVRTEHKSASVSGNLNWTFDAASLPFGTYTVRAEFRNSGNVVLGRAERVLRKLAPHPNEVRIDESARILINGKAIFPIAAWYCSELEIVKEAGFNTNWIFGGWGKVEGNVKSIRKHAAAGMPVNVGIAAATIQPDYFKETPFENVKDKLATLVAAYRDTPGFLAYDLLDEPQCYFSKPLDSWVKTKAFIDSADPYHPSRITQNAENAMSADYLKVCDIYAMDFYPGYIKGGLSRKPLGETALKVRYLRSILPRHIPIIPVLQAYDRLADEGMPNGRYADYREHRLLCWSSIAEGANGVEFWCYNFGYYSRMPSRPEWFGIRATVRELSALSGAILSDDASASSPDAGTETHFRLKKQNGALYFIAANSSLKERTLRFSSPEFEGHQTLSVVGENRTVRINGSTFCDVFPKYGVHIYTTAKTLPNIGSIAANEQEERRIFDAFEKKNAPDLFYSARHRGTLKFVISASRFGRELNLFDGISGSLWHAKSPKSVPFSFEVGTGRAEQYGRIVIECASGSPENVEVLGFADGAWKTIAKTVCPEEKTAEIAFAPERFEKIRILIQSVRGKTFAIDNIRAFAK